MNNEATKYKMICTLKFGDIYGQIIVWLIVVFLSLATTLALWSATRQAYALATVGLVVILSLPFLLFTFVTTLFNHIEFVPADLVETAKSSKKRSNLSGKTTPSVA